MYPIAHSVLKHRLGARSVATFITKRAALVRSWRSVRSFCGQRLGGGPSAAEVARLRWLLGVSCLRRWIRSSQNPLPRTWVNRLLPIDLPHHEDPRK